MLLILFSYVVVIGSCCVHGKKIGLTLCSTLILVVHIYLFIYISVSINSLIYIFVYSICI